MIFTWFSSSKMHLSQIFENGSLSWYEVILQIHFPSINLLDRLQILSSDGLSSSRGHVHALCQQGCFWSLLASPSKALFTGVSYFSNFTQCSFKTASERSFRGYELDWWPSGSKDFFDILTKKLPKCRRNGPGNGNYRRFIWERFNPNFMTRGMKHIFQKTSRHHLKSFSRERTGRVLRTRQ